MAKDKKKTSKHAEASAPEETKSTKKAGKSEKNAKKDGKKRNVFQSIGKWFHDLKVEFNNVTWPSRQTVVINTSVVLFVIVAGSTIVGLLDLGLLRLVNFLIGLSQ